MSKSKLWYGRKINQRMFKDDITRFLEVHIHAGCIHDVPLLRTKKREGICNLFIRSLGGSLRNSADVLLSLYMEGALRSG